MLITVWSYSRNWIEESASSSWLLFCGGTSSNLSLLCICLCIYPLLHELFMIFQFESSRDADDAIRGRDGYLFDGHRLRVSHIYSLFFISWLPSIDYYSFIPLFTPQVELAHGGRGQSSSIGRSSGHGSGHGSGSGKYGVSHRSEFRGELVLCLFYFMYSYLLDSLTLPFSHKINLFSAYKFIFCF